MFLKGNKKRDGKKKNKVVECRYRIPKMHRKETEIIDTGVETKWFDIYGSHKMQKKLESALKRHKLDCFQNQSCPGIGLSKVLMGNTNLSLIQESASAVYASKYVTKDTQTDGGADFEKVARLAQRAIL